MRTRKAAVVIAAILGCAAPAHADPRAEVAAKSRAAMAAYDSMDYEAARKLLYQALAIAKRAKLDKDPLVARVYLDLGIAQLAGSDQEAAKLALLTAAQIDPKITVDAAYKSPELVRLLDEAKAVAVGIDTSAEQPDGVDCRAIRGVQHTSVEGRRGAAQTIEAYVGGDLTPARVVVMYRPEGGLDFTEAKLTRQGSCKYVGSIPASAAHGNVVHYYIAAYDVNNHVLASKGSSGTPSVIELGPHSRDGGREVADASPPPPPTTGDTEDPVKSSSGRPVAPAGEVATGMVPVTSAPKLMLAMSFGTGFGYVSGKTEADNQVQSCCIGSSLIVLAPELAYYASPRVSVGIAGRLGFPIGANIAGHSTIAPAGFLRLHYAFADSGDGFHVMGEVGGGILRNTIKLDNAAASNIGPGMDTDIVAQGPLLLGAGVGYARHLGSAVAFLIDLDAMAGIAVVDRLGSAIHLNTGVSADMSLGLAVGF